MGELSKQLAQRAMDRLDGRITALQEAGIAVGVLAAQLQHAQRLFRQERTFETHALCQELLNVAADLALGKEDQSSIQQRVDAVVEQFVAPEPPAQSPAEPDQSNSAVPAAAISQEEPSSAEDALDPVEEEGEEREESVALPHVASPDMLAEQDGQHEEPESALFQLAEDDPEDLPATAEFFPAPAPRHATTPGKPVSSEDAARHQQDHQPPVDLQQALAPSTSNHPAGDGQDDLAERIRSQLQEGFADIAQTLQRIPDAEAIAQATSAALGAQWQDAVGKLLQVVEEMGAQAAEDRAILRDSIVHLGQPDEEQAEATPEQSAEQAGSSQVGSGNESAPIAPDQEDDLGSESAVDQEAVVQNGADLAPDQGEVQVYTDSISDVPHGDETQQEEAVHDDGHDTEASLAAIADDEHDIAIEHLDDQAETLVGDEHEMESSAAQSYRVEEVDREQLWNDPVGEDAPESIAPPEDESGSAPVAETVEKPHSTAAEDAEASAESQEGESDDSTDWDDQGETMIDSKSIDLESDAAETLAEEHQEVQARVNAESAQDHDTGSPVQSAVEQEEDPFAEDTDTEGAGGGQAEGEDSVALDVDSQDVAAMSMTAFARALEEVEAQEPSDSHDSPSTDDSDDEPFAEADDPSVMTASAGQQISPQGPGISDTAIGRILDGKPEAEDLMVEDAVGASVAESNPALRASTDSLRAPSALEHASPTPPPPPVNPAVAVDQRILREQVRSMMGECLDDMFDDPQVRQKLFAVLALEAATNPSALGELTGIRHFLRQELERVAAEQQASPL